jgi:hypothetical protein
METINSTSSIRVPWNKGKLVGQKAPFKRKEIWAIRIRLQIASRCRELALFNLVDSKLRACDLVQLRVRDVRHGQSMTSRATCGSASDFVATKPTLAIGRTGSIPGIGLPRATPGHQQSPGTRVRLAVSGHSAAIL